MAGSMRPPGMPYPGRKSLTPEREKENKTAHTVGGVIFGINEVLEARKARNRKRYPLGIDRLDKFHDANGVFREGPGHDVLRGWKCIAGRFAKDTTPEHKRPKRIPWDKPGRNELRRAKKAARAAKAAVTHE